MDRKKSNRFLNIVFPKNKQEFREVLKFSYCIFQGGELLEKEGERGLTFRDCILYDEITIVGENDLEFRSCAHNRYFFHHIFLIFRNYAL